MSAVQPPSVSAPPPSSDSVPAPGVVSDLRPTGAAPDAGTTSNTTAAQQSTTTTTTSATPHKSVRSFFGFGKKKDEEKQKKKANSPTAPIQTMAQSSPIHSPLTISASSSPRRGTLSSAHRLSTTIPHSPSGGLSSPASSSIFERDVQESAVPAQSSTAIPSHIQTENHIPPVLEASAEAITDTKLDPDNVEIVTHAAHQPAGATVANALGSNGSEVGGPASLDTQLAQPPSQHPEPVDLSAPMHSSMDPNDVRRLSFISFADVVQAEQGEHAMSDSGFLLGSPGPAAASVHSTKRSPSPGRSPPVSPPAGGSPPLSGTASFQGIEGSPRRGLRGSGSPVPHSPLLPHSPQAGEFNVETMRQALRKTGSGDLSIGRHPYATGPGSTDEAATSDQLSR
ncbi:hypothetical protein L228DRAFT_242064 [Xylona heveae TC161]|uniref:Uncharacterized protein n=1 Tax=Xylona heveae (strain CBS 132557 / TC161) TaxID=1328760 RepID=A0A164ZF55_XYLHT|nr:hypothetical protein L228DRAFT_242064 [Xylona heveae TC161]KZF19026.1 hypothetical protein L228DRAFT_242064 [Xylona heveae TC161]